MDQKSKVLSKISKVGESFTVYMYDNGYMLEVTGRNNSGDWTTSKTLITDLEDLFKLIEVISTMERDS